MGKLKVIGLLFLGAVLGQLILVGVSVLHFTHKIKDPNFLTQISMRSTDPHAMSNDELEIWNDMRQKIKHGEYAEVNRLIEITNGDLDIQVIPAKSVFTQGENILAEIRFKNTSSHTLHFNEPRVQRLTTEIYNYQESNQLDYDIFISPEESTWMRTLLPGQELSIPTLIAAKNIGPYKINYSVLFFQFNQTGVTPVNKQAICNFVIH